VLQDGGAAEAGQVAETQGRPALVEVGEEREVDAGGDKTVAEAEIEALLPWLAIASHNPDATAPSVDETRTAIAPAPATQVVEQPEQWGQEMEPATAEKGARAPRRDSWGSEILFLFEMFPDVDPSKVQEQLAACGDDLQQVANVLLLSQVDRTESTNRGEFDDNDLLQYDVGFQLEDEAQRQEQMVIDQQIARDCQLAFDLDREEDAAAASARAQPSRYWAEKVDGLGGASMGARQRRQLKSGQPIEIDFRRGSHQQHNAPIRSSQWQQDAAFRPGGGGGGGGGSSSNISERIVLRQLDDLYREFCTAGEATVEDVWEQCGRCYHTAREHLRLMTQEADEVEPHGTANAAAHRYEYRYRDEGFAEDGEAYEDGGDHDEGGWDGVPSRGSSVRGAARRKRLKDEWKTVGFGFRVRV